MNMFKEKHFFKKLILPTFTAFAAFIGFTGFCAANVYAAETQTVQLKESGNEAEIILTFPEAAKEEISSLQISLSVSASPNGANVEFVPNENLAAKIAEGRYNKESGILNIYAAGTSPLFDKVNPVLSLGRVRVTDSGSYADVKIVENSLKFVRGTELVVQDTGVEYSGDIVRISSYSSDTTQPSYTGNYGGGGFTVPDVTTTAVTAEAPPAESATTTAAVSVTAAPSTDIPSTGDNVPAIPVEGESFSAADTERLSEAVSRAETYKRSEYTDDSYRTLEEALKRAKTLLADRESGQEQIDEALLILENAIGMLVPANSPSRADSIPDSEADHIVSEEVGAGGADPDVSLVSGEETKPDESETKTPDNMPDITMGGGADTTESITEQGYDTDEGAPDNTSESENSSEEGGDITVWIIVLVVLGAAAAVTAIAAVVSSKKKKSVRRGNHSRTKSSKSRSRDGEDEDENEDE